MAENCEKSTFTVALGGADNWDFWLKAFRVKWNTSFEDEIGPECVEYNRWTEKRRGTAVWAACKRSKPNVHVD